MLGRYLTSKGEQLINKIGITIIAKRRLELKSLKHSETRILNGNGYKSTRLQTIVYQILQVRPKYRQLLA